MSEAEAEELFAAAARGDIDAETVGEKLREMIEAEATAAEAETPEEIEDGGEEIETAAPDDPILIALGVYLGVVQETLGADAPIQPCAYCHGMGFNPIELKADPHSHKCEGCDGFGEVTTFSKVTGNEARMCQDCKGAGYIAEQPEIIIPGGEKPTEPVSVLSDAEVAEIVRKAQEQAGVNAA